MPKKSGSKLPHSKTIKKCFITHKFIIAFGQKKDLNCHAVKVGNKKLGGDLLSRTLVYSTIGDEGLDF
jgi:hypothetical protein